MLSVLLMVNRGGYKTRPYSYDYLTTGGVILASVDV